MNNIIITIHGQRWIIPRDMVDTLIQFLNSIAVQSTDHQLKEKNIKGERQLII